MKASQIVSRMEGGINFGKVAIREGDLVQLQLPLGERESVGDNAFPETGVEAEAVPRFHRSTPAA
jgi:hypothetical protein